MLLRYLSVLTFAAFVAATAPVARALDPSNQDIDLFLGNPAESTARPNVLILLDNTANWNLPFDNEKKALATVVDNLSDEFNLGLMMFPETGDPNDSVDGGYVRFGVRQMDDGARTALVELIKDFDKGHDKGNNATFSLLMYEAYAYFAGIEARSGFGKVKRDAAGNSTYNPYAYNLPGNALSSMSDRTYVSPITEGCQKNYVIVISNGPASDNSSSLAKAQALLAGIMKTSTPPTINIAAPYDDSENNWTDEYAKYMAEGDCNLTLDGEQHVYTYTVEIDPGQRRQDLAHTKLMQSAAAAGKGRYFAVTSANNGVDIVTTLEEIFTEIQAVNSVFAATTLPVSINVRGTNANQVYMGVFRPDDNARPRWFGNLKLYNIGIDRVVTPPELFLADAAGRRAEDQSSGFILPGARSFWTSASNYWAFRGSYDVSDLGKASDSPDGPIVEKGGSAQKQRAVNPTARKLYTCAGGCTSGEALSSNVFNSANTAITATDLDAADNTERAQIIDWVRGLDLDDENQDGSTADTRASVHGDVLHSQPSVVNYNRSGTNDDGDIFVFYGANDGVMRAVAGGLDSSDGQEAWGFIAPEHFGKLKRLRENGPAIGSANKKPYFFDGAIVTYTRDVNSDGRLVATDGDKVYLFMAMRRGGRSLYALDVSNPTDPKFMWKKGCPHDSDNTGCDAGFAELGQTWSDPNVTFLRAFGPSMPVLVVGAGYDAAVEDVPPCLMTGATATSVTALSGGTLSYSTNGTCTMSGGVSQTINRSMGRGVLVMNALTGQLLWRVGPDAGANVTLPKMTYSIAGRVVVLNRDRDISRAITGTENIVPGYADRLYAADTGGNIWRIDVSGNNTSDWTGYQLAELGGSLVNSRKFLNRVDVVYGKDEGGSYDGVLIGSGDREHPFDTSVLNRFYMIKDRMVAPVAPVSTPALIKETDLYDATSNCLQQCTDQALSDARAQLSDATGWYFDLRAGEKTVSAATTVSGTVFFNTNQPLANTCGSNLGTAREYQVSYKNAAAVRDLVVGNDLNADDRSGERAGGGYLPEHQPFLIDFGSSDAEADYQQGVISGTNVNRVDAVPFGARLRTFWYKRIE
jgi:type IV pilus assembly protein PilY1